MIRQNSRKTIIKTVDELLDTLDLDPEQRAIATRGLQDFPVRVPEDWIQKIAPGDWNDPLLRQVLPLDDEDHNAAGFVSDPVGDQQAEVVPGLLHKYQGRVLMVLTGSCPIHCRYCFRRHFDYQESALKPEALAQALEYIESHSDIHEVIYSGGDPLSLSDAYLTNVTGQIARIPHVQRLRIHSRIPIVTPERIQASTIEWLHTKGIQPIMVVHSNHAQELDDKVKAAITLFTEAQIPVLNQAVLLRGINDSVKALQRLSETLFEYGILPYYLHQLDKVEGAAHFAVADKKAISLHKTLQASLPGYLVPRLVREIAGENHKTPVAKKYAK